MSKIKCFKCKGSGQTGIEVSPLVGFLTAGIAFLADTAETCDACGGCGYLEEDDE